MEKKIIYTWKQFDNDTGKISKFVSQYQGMVKNIYGIPRGGLPLAVKLSHLLELPLVLNPKQIGKNTLVVDDISDTGETLFKLLKDKMPFGVVTLFLKRTSKFKPIFHCRKVDKEWVVFPWETLKTSKKNNI